MSKLYQVIASSVDAYVVVDNQTEHREGDNMTRNFQVIFQSANGKDGKWLDYSRECAPAETLGAAEAWASKTARQLERHIGCGVRWRTEDWGTNAYTRR